MVLRRLSETAGVRAAPEQVFDAVSDLRRMAAWSPEYMASWRFWRRAPRRGVMIVGWNRAGRRVWCTTCRVVTVDRPTTFAFDSGVLGLPIARWTYQISPDGDGGSTGVESWDDLRGDDRTGRLARWLGLVFTGASTQDRVQRNTAGMRATLQRLAADVELDAT